jgi:hypothetical protein
VLLANMESVNVADDACVLDEACDCDLDDKREDGTSAIVAMSASEVDFDVETDTEMLLRVRDDDNDDDDNDDDDDDDDKDAVPVGR